MAFLPFFRKGVVAGYVNGTLTVYTQPLITEKFVKVVATLRVDAPLVSTNPADGIGISPQISNDLVNWDDTTPNFTNVGPASSFPITESIELTEIARYMRFKIILSKPMLAGPIGMTFSLPADGKIAPDETLDMEYGFYDPAMMTPPLYAAAAASPLVSAFVPGPGGNALQANAVVPGAALARPGGGGPGTVTMYPKGRNPYTVPLPVREGGGGGGSPDVGYVPSQKGRGPRAKAPPVGPRVQFGGGPSGMAGPFIGGRQ